MSYIFTKVPIHWSPNSNYHLTDQITLKPAYRVPYTYPRGLILYHDTLYFISASKSMEDHINILRQWVIFHSFIFDMHLLCDHFENGWLNEHHQVSNINEIHEDNDKEKNAYPINYDDVGNEIYWLYKPRTVISYKTLFKRYQQLQDTEMNLLTSYLLDVEQRSADVLQYALFHAQREYWQIFVYVTVLEAILGHATNCPGSEVLCGRTPANWWKGARKDLKKEHPSVNCVYAKNDTRSDGCLQTILPESGVHCKRESWARQCCQSWTQASPLSLQDLRKNGKSQRRARCLQGCARQAR